MNLRNTFRSLFLCGLLIAAVSPSAIACFIPPHYLSDHHTELVDTTGTIVLARAIEKTRDGTGAVFVFQTLEILKGQALPQFELYGFEADGWLAREIEYANRSPDFDGHRSAEFWAWSAGNSTMLTSCFLAGFFELGETYLLFLRDDPHRRAYENIRGDDDLWLQVIRRVVENSGEGVFEDDGSFLPETETLDECFDMAMSLAREREMRLRILDICLKRHESESDSSD